MKISIDQRSPNWWRLHFNEPEIYLDGAVVDHVISADESTGTVLVVDYDEGGRPRHAGGQFINKILTGKVEIREKQKEEDHD